jgi:hypothetical protein
VYTYKIDVTLEQGAEELEFVYRATVKSELAPVI